MSEKTQRRTVLKVLKAQDACAVENPAGLGTPDVNYVEGWIELKWLARWPKNAATSAVRIEHFTPQQRVWLLRRKRAGGNVWLLLQVGREWLLFDGETAARRVGLSNRAELYCHAVKHWPSGLNNEEFIAWVTKAVSEN